MDQEDYPLLHFPDLVLALLRAGQDRAGTIAEAELATHLDRARRHLMAAHVVEMLDQHSFRITPCGHAMLQQHPDGIDDGLLSCTDVFFLDGRHGP